MYATIVLTQRCHPNTMTTVHVTNGALVPGTGASLDRPHGGLQHVAADLAADARKTISVGTSIEEEHTPADNLPSPSV